MPVVLAAIVSVGVLAASPGGTAPAETDLPVQRWLAAFDPATGLPDDLPRVLAEVGAIEAVALTTIDVLAVTLPADGIGRLVQRADVIAARPERRLAFHLDDSVPFIGADRASLDVPQTVTVDGPDGAVEVQRPAVDGSGQVVAVVDTGVWAEHPDLAGQVLASRNFELAYAGELILTAEQLDAFAETTGPLAGPGDDVGHGTHVAGIVAGTGAGTSGRANRNSGVAPGAAMVDLRISSQAHTTDNNIGWERNALAAYDWLLRHHDDAEWGPQGIRVVNNSWGLGPSTFGGEEPDYSPFEQFLPALAGAGVTVVFGAGNGGTADDVTESRLPTGHPDVITVAAGCHPGAVSHGCRWHDPDAGIAPFSSRGPALDVTAPGVDIVSAVNASSGALLGQLSGDFSGQAPQDAVSNRVLHANLSGTSMSAPHVAGAVALMLEASPGLSPHDVRVILGATARDVLDAGRDHDTGWGVIDVPAALVAAARHAAGTTVSDQFPDFDHSATS